MKKFAWVLSLSLVGGCSHFRPQLPEITLPTEWKQKQDISNHPLFEKNFWELFEDPVLNELEQKAIAANLDLKAAIYRIEEAQALTLKEHAKRLPKADLSGSFYNDETLLNPPSFGSPTQKLKRVEQQQYRLLTNLSYELDLWGKLRDEEKSAKLKARAAEWEYDFIYQTLTAQVAIHYIQIRTLEEEKIFLEKTLELWKDKVNLYRNRFDAGVDASLDVSRAQLELALIQADLEQTERVLTAEKNSLATLLAIPASSFELAQGVLPKVSLTIPSVLPSEMLMRRADVRRAWTLVAGAQTEVDAALKAYFPSFSLSSAIGLASPKITDFFVWEARYWNYMFSMLEPIFDGGKRKAHVKGTKARFYEYFTLYQKSVNQAFQDVEDGLSSYHYMSRQLNAQTEAVKAALETSDLAAEQFRAGLISYLLVADSQNQHIQTQRAAIVLKGQQLLAWIRVMKALGIQKQKSVSSDIQMSNK